MANSEDHNEAAHNEPPYPDLQFASSTIFISSALSINTELNNDLLP